MKSRGIHLQILGVELGVNVVLSPSPPLFSQYPIGGYAEEDIVCVQGYKGSKVCYYTGLHELGHVAMGHCVERLSWYNKNVLEGESEAWQWALDNSQEELDYDTKRFILSDVALGSYSKQLSIDVGFPGPNFYLVLAKMQ